MVLLFEAPKAPAREQLEFADGLVDLAATALSRAARFDELRRAHAALRFSRQSSAPALETVDVNPLAHEATELAKPRMVGRAASGRIEIREEIGSPPAVAARPGEVVSALLNVIVNAIDAMRDGGTITVRTGEVRGGAMVEVVDDGPGMSADVASRVFDPFFTTKGEAGTGLGHAARVPPAGELAPAIRAKGLDSSRSPREVARNGIPVARKQWAQGSRALPGRHDLRRGGREIVHAPDRL